MKRAITILAVLAAVLAGPASASAAPFPPEYANFVRVAESYWGHAPANCSSISYEVEDSGTWIEREGKLYAGWATIPNELPVPCSMLIAGGLEPWYACITITHEEGHLDGLGHSDNPADIMYPEMTVQKVVPGCPPRPPATEAAATAGGAPSAEVAVKSPAEEALWNLEVIREQGWREWRELRAVCREVRGAHRIRCRHHLRRFGARLRREAEAMIAQAGA